MFYQIIIVARIVECENYIEELKKMKEEFESKLKSFEETTRLMNEEKNVVNNMYNMLLEKYKGVKEDNEQIVNSSLKNRQDQINEINRMTEE